MFFDNYCGIDDILSLGPKKSTETNISKKVLFTVTKGFGLFFFPIIEIDKPQRTIDKSKQGFLTNNMQVIRSYLYNKRSQ